MTSRSQIAIVDYRMGNLRSVQKALEKVGAKAIVTSDAASIAAARKVILPGVGAFGDAIAELQARDLVEPIVKSIASGKPFLGICLGLQLLFEVGWEGGEHVGLGVLKGEVVRFSADSGLKIPHMGWNRVNTVQADCPLFRSIPDEAYFYFVHSFFCVPQSPRVTWLTCEYGIEFCAAAWRDNLFATQFHPEKSQSDGLQLLRNFAELPA